MRDQKLLRFLAITTMLLYIVPPIISYVGISIFATILFPPIILIWLTPLAVSIYSFYLSRKIDLSRSSSEVFICVFLGLIILLAEIAGLVSAFKSGEWWPKMGPLRM